MFIKRFIGNRNGKFRKLLKLDDGLYYLGSGMEVERNKHTNKKIFDYRKIWINSRADRRNYLFADRHLRLIENEPVNYRTENFFDIELITGAKNAAEFETIYVEKSRET